MKFIITYILVGVLILPLFSQVIYVSTEDYVDRYNDILKLDLSNCTYNLECDNETYEDFSIRPDGTWVVIENLIVTGWYQMNQCKRMKWGGVIFPINELTISVSAESDKYGNVWLFGPDGLGMVKVNPPSTLYDFKGQIDRTLFNSFRSTFLDGKYYSICTYKSNPTQQMVVEFDTLDPKISRVVITIPNNLNFISIIPLHISCGNNRLILSNFSEFYELEIKTGTIKFICNINFPARYSMVFEGASPWPYDPRDCDVFIDLDIDNSSGDTKNGFITTYNCKDDRPFLSDRDPDIFSDYGIMDSLRIKILNPLDGIQEGFVYSGGYQVMSTSSGNLMSLYPSGLATNDSLEFAIQSLRYENNSCMVTVGNRIIEFITFKNGITDTAYCTLKVEGPFYNAGQYGLVKLCRNDAPILLENYLGNCYTKGGTWWPAPANAGMFDAAVDKDSIYYYVVGDSNCGYDSARVQVNVSEATFFQFGKDTSICEGDSLIILSNLAGVKHLWNDGTQSAQKIIKKTGLYWLEVTNSNFCNHRDSIYITVNNRNLISKELFLCANQVLNYKNNNYVPGDLIKDTLPSILSCDTFLEIKIIGLSLPIFSLTADTIICKNATSLISSKSNFKSYLWNTNETSSEISGTSGTYVLTVTDQNGCTNSASIQIVEAPIIISEKEVYDPVCQSDQGRIILKASQGGIAPIRYFLNGIESRNGVFDQLIPGLYISEIVDGEGCKETDSLYILATAGIDVSIVEKIEIDAGKSVLIQYISINGKLKSISFLPNENIFLEGNDGIRINTTVDQKYEITFEDEYGCTIIRKLQVIIKRSDELYFPNIFSPNGDGINDYWEGIIGTEYQLLHCQIFDRWGGKVYESSDQVKWDGSVKSGPCLPGVYVYELELVDQKGTIRKDYGNISLVR